MRNYLLFVFLAVVSISINAKTVNKQEVPEKVFKYIYKKYPNAQDFVIEEKTHFNLSLYGVTFMTDRYDQNNQLQQEKFTKLFRVNGNFYTNAIKVDNNAFNIISDITKKSLQLRYPEYELLALKVVNNPNGRGEEYEADLLVSGQIWNISIDDQGGLISETRQ